METDKRIYPDYIFESSWEVCNKVGGIYTVLSTRAKTLQELSKDKIIFIGPDCWKETESPYFKQDNHLLAPWRQQLGDSLHVRVGRWNIPGRPIAILVDFTPFYEQKNEIYGQMWQLYGVDSLHAYGDYDEASMFSMAAAKVVESFCRYYMPEGLQDKKVVYHANEWMTGLGLLYLQHTMPEVATIFTTHATSIGRSIAGNNKPLYDYLWAYNGDEMSHELNVESKHSIEKQTALHCDCFTTVSDITAHECRELLDKPADVVLPNGFEDSFVPRGAKFEKQRKAARERLLKLANRLTGCHYDDDTLIISTSGRYEFRNKGIDVYLEAMARLCRSSLLDRQIVAFVWVPGWCAGPREDLKTRMAADKEYTSPLIYPHLTHWLHDMNNDQVLTMLHRLDVYNRPEDKMKIIFVPCYLTGDDGIMGMSYYDLVGGNDLCIFPSYYEPWGYTPLEAVAFGVPCITTDLAGFGAWVNSVVGHEGQLADGVKVIHRTDYNYHEVADTIKGTVLEYANLSADKAKAIRKKAKELSKRALWSKFIEYYLDAYDFALRKAADRA